jgi:hypothetical protein
LGAWQAISAASRTAIFSKLNSRFVRDSIFTAAAATSTNWPARSMAAEAVAAELLLPALVGVLLVLPLPGSVGLVAKALGEVVEELPPGLARGGARLGSSASLR